MPRGKGAGGGMDWEFGISRCKLLYIEWTNNKVLLYSTGNYIQYPVINQNGKEDKKECIKKEYKGPSTGSVSSTNYYYSTIGPGLEKTKKRRERQKHSGGDNAG